MAYIKDSGNISGGIKPSSSKPNPKPPAPPKDNSNTGVDTGGNGGGVVSGGRQPEYNYNPYEDYMDEINRQRRREEEARRNAIDAGVGQLQSQIPLLERQRDDASRQAYIRAQQSQANMPQQLAAMGSTGGLSESSIMQANAGYQNTQNELTNAYQDALAGVNGDIANLKSSGELSIVDNSGKYYQQLLDLAAKQAQEASAQQQKTNNASEQVADTYGFKNNDTYVKALRSTAVKNWLQKLSDNEQRNPPANEQIKNSERYYALKSAYKQGMFTDAEYSAIAKSWGIPV